MILCYRVNVIEVLQLYMITVWYSVLPSQSYWSTTALYDYDLIFCVTESTLLKYYSFIWLRSDILCYRINVIEVLQLYMITIWYSVLPSQRYWSTTALYDYDLIVKFVSNIPLYICCCITLLDTITLNKRSQNVISD